MSWILIAKDELIFDDDEMKESCMHIRRREIIISCFFIFERAWLYNERENENTATFQQPSLESLFRSGYIRVK